MAAISDDTASARDSPQQDGSGTPHVRLCENHAVAMGRSQSSDATARVPGL